MFRLLGFLFGVALAIIVLAMIVFAPIRERTGALATEITGVIFDSADELNLEQGDEVSEVAVVPALIQGKRTLPEAETIKVAEAATPSLAQESESPHESSTTATQLKATAQLVAQETEVLPMQPASNAKKIVSPVSSAQQELTSTDPRATDDVNQTKGEPVVWQPVWRAFRSELSAQGFAGHLQHLTGQAYRVRRTSPWSYQVELAYVDERQRDNLLHEIRTKTGLGLVEMQP